MRLTIKKKIIIAILFFFFSSLGALLLVRELVKRDFLDYTEGEKEDMVYVLTSLFESQYEKDGFFDKNRSQDAALVALSMGYQIKLFDENGRFVIDTREAIDNVQPLAKRRYASHIKIFEDNKENPNFQTYSLFLKSNEIGTLHLSKFEGKKQLFFIERTFLFLTFGIIGALLSSFVLGLFITSRILSPIAKLHKAALDISKGLNVEYIEVNRNDELGELSQAFNTMAKNLSERERVRKTSMAKFAHELRTPIAVMQAEIEGMLDDVLPINKARLESVREEIFRLRKMVEGLENLYSIEKRAKRMQMETVKINDLLIQIANKFIAKAREKNISIVVNCDNSVIHNDPALLTQILFNLMTNAIEATKQGQIVLGCNSDDKHVFITVSDTGKGITNEDLPFIFESFYSKSEKGLGIGLAIVKDLTEILSGEISVSSEYGRGTTFVLKFKR